MPDASVAHAKTSSLLLYQQQNSKLRHDRRLLIVIKFACSVKISGAPRVRCPVYPAADGKSRDQNNDWRKYIMPSMSDGHMLVN